MSKRKMALGGAVALVAVTAAPAALAQDFFSALFGAFGVQRPQPRVQSYGGTQAYCVRTCDGRYFPISSTGNQSRAASCKSFCPASETKVAYGGTIDNAVTEDGKPYSELPNAFRYREEFVAGCTCNGKDTVGLAKVEIEDDTTLRKGDFVAGPDGLMVAGHGPDRRGASLSFSPAPDSIRSHYQRMPVVARQ
ncbi:DUF2865 domain-containing protein [Bradyrhizobium sp.]|uniref:DUF2865 domain-containing protein n=1 Tax=Bradyrhizobium sp. TaxID=376 RepID=UPI0026193240|nr:DUF2865 domain-containing protein [Bradyrhizobium sp.]